MTDLSPLGALIAAQDWAGAERLLRAAATAPNAPAAVFYNLAKVLEAAGQDAERRDWLQRAVAADPGYAIAWFELARAALAEDALEAAQDGFARAWALAPQDGDAALSLARVALRRGDWAEALRAAQPLGPLAEARAIRYRALCETGQRAAAQEEMAALLAVPNARPHALKALTRVAHGRLPLRLPAAGG